MKTTTEARERPILFSGPMVRAIMEGRKTQTRRVVKPEPAGIEPTLEPSGKWVWWRVEDDRNVWDERRCPYGQPGDLLYVRETWADTTNVNGQADWPQRPHIDPDPDWSADSGVVRSAIIYRADGPWLWLSDEGFEDGRSHWRPSIFMPKAYARIWLRVTDVRVERVQELTYGDALAEGVPQSEVGRGAADRAINTIGAFRDLWDSINADRGHPWESNPSVWVVTFERADR